ncbi:glycosyl transferase [Escherichia coli]|nr:glycosyl transferase [Escherichia coli]
MHGTEGEVYAKPQRRPQINLIDREGMRGVYGKKDPAGAGVTPTGKKPENPAQRE